MRRIIKNVSYDIKQDLATALKKVIGGIGDVDFAENYKLTDSEIELVHEFYKVVLDEEEAE